MAKKEKTPTTAEALTQLATSKGMDISQVFDHFLMYIIWAHTLPEYGKPIEGWPYKPEESKRMFEIYGIPHIRPMTKDEYLERLQSA